MARVDSYSRRSFLRTAALGSVGLALAPRARAQAVARVDKPNLLVFLPDQQRADTLICYGAKKSYAPNLDKLAEQSFVFDQTYVTHPLCTPSRSSLLTGTWPHTNGCTENGLVLPTSYRCIPEIINDPDYRFAWMGKWHLGNEQLAQRGFEDWMSIIDGHVFEEDGKTSRDLSDYDKFLLSNGLKVGKNGVFSQQFDTTVPLRLSKPKFLEMKACEFLQHHRRHPFVLFVAFQEPHPPYNGPLNKIHPLEEISLDPTFDNVFGDNMPLRYRLRQEDIGREETANGFVRTKRRYLGLVTEMDLAVGAILQKLERLELADRTIVIHTSDHGDMMSAHRLLGKQVLFQEAVRVPYLVRMANQRRSVSVRQSISHIDFVPTLVDLLGGTRHPQCAGKSRAAILRGETNGPEPVFMQWTPERKHPNESDTRLAERQEIDRALGESTRAIISPDGWKLCLRDSDKNELYNLATDPGEVSNVYEQARGSEVVARLSGEIHRWQEKVSDAVRV